MATIEFTREEKEELIKKLQTYLLDELDKDISRFEAEFLLDFISKDIGPLYYNRGLYDAKGTIENRFEEISESIYALEK